MQTWVPAALDALTRACRGQAPPLEFTAGEQGTGKHSADKQSAGKHGTDKQSAAPGWLSRPDVLTGAHAETGIRAGTEAPAVVVRTSGSTGTPKQTLLTATALRSSARMTAARLGGHGQWLLTLQPGYVAGLAVLSRSIEAGTVPQALLEGTTDPDRFAAAARGLTHRRRYVSLVPAQLERLLRAAEDGHLGCREALRRFDAVLLGGAASDPALLRRAAEAGVHAVRTYGMSETAGGCVYDGVPLDGVRIGLSPTGRIQLSGPMVAAGYFADPELTGDRFDTDPVTGEPRFTTEDLGELTPGEADEPPRLQVTGRTDDVVNTGGVKVSAEAVRLRLIGHPDVAEAFVGAAPDPIWGERICAAVVPSPGTGAEPHPADCAPTDDIHADGTPADCAPADDPRWRRVLAEHTRTALGNPAAPKLVVVLRELPRLPSGKPDRRALLDLFRRTHPVSSDQKEPRGHD